MNSCPHKQRRRIARSVVALSGFLAVFGSGAVAGEIIGAVPLADQKTHAVFVGLDLSVDYKGQSRRVVGITKTSAELDIDGAVRRVPPETLNQFKLDRGPKVSGTFVNLGSITVERSFRSGGIVDQAWAQARQSEWLAEGIKEIVDGTTQFDDASPKVREALKDIEDSPGMRILIVDTLRRYTDAGEVQHGDLESEAHRDNLFDALNIGFDISSPEPVADCYLVMVSIVRARRPGPQVGQMIFFRELGEIDSKPRRVRMQFAGLPVGFELLRAEYHIYSRAQELASNVAPNRMLLTEEQAHQFMLLQYAADNKGKSLPARIVAAPLRAESEKRFSRREMEASLRLAIDQSGYVTRVAGANASKSLQDYVASLPFYPALENGKAAASTLNVSLADLLRP